MYIYKATPLDVDYIEKFYKLVGENVKVGTNETVFSGERVIILSLVL